MNRHQTSRLLATLLLGVLFGWFLHHDSMKWNHLGRAAFLADQSHHFDTADTNPPPLAAMMVVSAILTGVLFGVYELLALLIGATLKPFFPENKPNNPASIPFS